MTSLDQASIAELSARFSGVLLLPINRATMMHAGYTTV